MSDQLKFAQCMRSHGVSDFPDPGAGGGFLNAISRVGTNGDLNPNNPIYQSAQRACEKYTPTAHETPAQRAADVAQGLELTQCMRTHGVPNFPDPTTGPGGGEAINLGPENIDPTSTRFQAAQRACQHIVPDGK